MSDPYYQTLPFTLSEEQLDYDYLILGTNLQACMIAAHLSKIQKQKGLILQLQKGYGGDLKTLSLKQLHEFMTTKQLSLQYNAPLLFKSILPQSFLQKNAQEINQRKQTAKGLRGYNIDLQPKVFCGSSLACEMLKQANMDQYMDFRLIKKVLFILNNKLQEVPLNLKTIMNAQGLSLFQRKDLFKGIHQLVKIYYKYHSVEADNNSTNQFDKDTDVNQQLYNIFIEDRNTNCSKFLMKALNNKQKLFDMVMFGICGYQLRKPHEYVEGQYTCLEMIKKFGRFVKSCGVYSQTPYLYVDNGIGDIPQAYSRISSIFGGIFIIHPQIEIESVEEKEDGYDVKSNLAPGTKIHTKNIIYTDPYYLYLNEKLGIPTELFEQHVLRLILIYKKPSEFKHVGPLVIHNFENKKFINPITCFLFDSESSSTPDDQFLLHINVIVEETDEKVLGELVEGLMKDYEGLLGMSDLRYVAAYVQTNRYLNEYKNHPLKNDWNFDLEGATDIFKEIIGQQKSYFREETKDNQNAEEEGYYEGLLNKLDNLKEKKIENENKKESEENQKEDNQNLSEQKEQDNKPQQNKIIQGQQQIKQTSNKNQAQATQVPVELNVGKQQVHQQIVDQSLNNTDQQQHSIPTPNQSAEQQNNS